MNAEDVHITTEDVQQLLGCFNEIISVLKSPIDSIGQLPSRNFPLSNKHFNVEQTTDDTEILVAFYR